MERAQVKAQGGATDLIERSYPILAQEIKKSLNVAGLIPHRQRRDTPFQLEVSHILFE
jgi:hypothetical protein